MPDHDPEFSIDPSALDEYMEDDGDEDELQLPMHGHGQAGPSGLHVQHASMNLPPQVVGNPNSFNTGASQDPVDDDLQSTSGLPSILPFASAMDDYNPLHMGIGINDPEPPSFTGEKHKHWEVYDANTLYSEGSGDCDPQGGECRPKWFKPARVLAVNAERKHFKDSKIFGDNFEHLENAPMMHQKAMMALLGSITAGEAKGWVNGTRHQELVHARKQSAPEQDGKKMDIAKMLEKQLDGKINSYTYCPYSHVDNPDVSEQERTFGAPSFLMGCETLYDRTGLTKIGYRIFKFIFNKDHSDTRNCKRLFQENSELTASGRLAQKSVNQRDEKYVKAAVQSRTVTAPRLAINSIKNVRDYRTAAMMYGGKSSESEGKPLIDWSKVSPGALHQAMEVDDVAGGNHCLCPEYLLNFRRSGVATAGMVDCSLGGGEHQIHPDQADPENYYDSEGRFKPCKFSEDHGCFRVLINPEGRDFMDAPLPESMDIGQDVDEDLLRLFFEESYENVAIKNAMSVRNIPQVIVREYKRSNEFHGSLDDNGQETPQTKALMDAYVKKKEFEMLLDVIKEQFWRLKTKNDVGLQGLAGDMSRMITQALQDDSLQATPEDIERAKNYYSGGVDIYNTDPSGTHVLEPPQHLKRLSAELVNVHEFINKTYRKRKELAAERKVDTEESARKKHKEEQEETRHDYNEGRIDQEEYDERTQKSEEEFEDSIAASSEECRRSSIDAQVRCAKAMRGLHKLGLEQFEEGYTSKASRRTIPAGWLSICEGTRKEFVWLSDNAKHCKVSESANNGTGTANMAFANGFSQTSKDVSSYGQWRQTLMGILSDVAQVQGGAVRIMTEVYYHAFEVAHPVSYYLLLCGGAGIGKSMRMERMQEMFVRNWIRPAGPASEMSGQNGGMDETCGSMVYKDEIDEEFSSNEAPRLEFLKRIASDNAFQRLRSVPETVNGQTRYKTRLLWSLHYETTVYSTNRGQTGTKENEEPDANRAPLVDRTVSQQVFESDALAPLQLSEFQKTLEEPATRRKINTLRIISGLTAHILIYLKHLPFAQPNMAYAMRVFNEIDEIFWKEYNIPKPSPRKQTKRKMALLTMVVESAVVAKFYTQEFASDFEDMLPDADGHISNFSPAQLVDVVQSLQMHVDLEKIMLALSHAYDYHFPTTAHCFHVNLLLAQLHGSEIDQKRLPTSDASEVKWATPQVNANSSTVQNQNTDSDQPSSSTEPPPVVDAAVERQRMREEAEERRHTAVNESEQMRINQDQEARDAQQHIIQEDRPTVPPRANTSGFGQQHAVGMHGSDLGSYSNGDSEMCSVIQDHLTTRQRVREFAVGQKQVVRYRNILSSKLHTNSIKRKRDDPTVTHITNALTTIVDDKPVFIDPADSTKVLNVDEAVSVCMPQVQDLIDAGHPEKLINSVSTVGFLPRNDGCVENGVLGTRTGDKSGWNYVLKNKYLSSDENASKAFQDAASYSFDYAQLNVMERDESSKQRFTKASEHIYAAAQQGNSILKGGNPVVDLNLSKIALRDTLWGLHNQGADNKYRLPKQSNMHTDISASLRDHKIGTVSMVTHAHGEREPIRTAADARNNDMFTLNSKEPNKTEAETCRMNRPEESKAFVGSGDNQLKLDYMVKKNDFVAAIPTDSYVTGQPVRFQNGCFQVHKKYLSNQTQFAVLIAADLSTRPGVMNTTDDSMHQGRVGSFTVPESLKRPSTVSQESSSKRQRTDDASPMDVDLKKEDMNQPVTSLFFHWEMLSMYLTFTAAEFFHNDCLSYISKFKDKFPDVFTEELPELIGGLPHLTMRYAGRQAGATAKALLPLSVQVPTDQTRVRNVEEGVNKDVMHDTNISIAKYLSSMNSCDIQPEDPEVEEWKIKQEGGMAMPNITGNLFALSTWQNFTYNSMIDGLHMEQTDKNKVARLRDWGLNLRKRVLNKRIVDAHASSGDEKDESLKYFSRRTLLGTNTWLAIERDERSSNQKRSDALRMDTELTMSQRRKRELHKLDQMMAGSFNSNEIDTCSLPPSKKQASTTSRAGPSS